MLSAGWTRRRPGSSLGSTWTPRPVGHRARICRTVASRSGPPSGTVVQVEGILRRHVYRARDRPISGVLPSDVQSLVKRLSTVPRAGSRRPSPPRRWALLTGAVCHLQVCGSRQAPGVLTLRRDEAAKGRETQGRADHHRAGPSARGGHAGALPGLVSSLSGPGCARVKSSASPRSGRLPATHSDGRSATRGHLGTGAVLWPPRLRPASGLFHCRPSSLTGSLLTSRPSLP